MEISLTSTQGLERRLTVVLPPEVVEDKVKARLRSLAGKVRLDGFRPGKVPFNVIEKRYGAQVRAEVSEDVLQESFREALTKEKLRPVGAPEIESAKLEPGKSFEFTAIFEVYPEVQVTIPEGASVDKKVASVSESDVATVLERMRKQHTAWEMSDACAEDGDQVNVNFLGTLNGEPFEGGEAKDFNVIIGSKTLVGEFEQSLIGLKSGDEKTIQVTFPEDYGVKKLAGQTAQFAIKVNSVSKPMLPELDEEFAKRFGIDSVDSLKEQVQANIAREADSAVKNDLKTKVLDILMNAINFDVPKALVDNEARSRMERVKAQLSAGGVTAESLNLDPTIFEAPALRSVKVGLIIAEIIKANGIKVTSDQLRKAVDDIAVTYDEPEEVRKWYFGSRDRLSDLEALLLEDMAIDWVVNKLNVQESPVSATELLSKADS